MENILVKVLNLTFKLEKINHDSCKQLFILLENNREDLFNLQLDVSLIESKNEFDKLIKKAIEFFVIYKNDVLIGCIYVDKWGLYDELHFWLDKDNRDNKVFTEIISLFIKSYVAKYNSDLMIWAVRQKSIVSKKLTKKLGFKTIFRYNTKIVEFDQKKVIPAIYTYKMYNSNLDLHSLIKEIDQALISELQTFCLDLVDYTFKRNDFYINTKCGYYYWSGHDVTLELKEVYFVNVAKSKSVYKKMIKKISDVEEYLNLYNNCKTFYIIYHRIYNTFSLMFVNSNRKVEWIHFDNAII